MSSHSASEELRLYRQAQSLAAQRQVLQAELVLRQLLALNPGHADAKRGLAWLARDRGDFDRALEILLELRAAQPRSPDIALELAQTQAAAGQLALAEYTLQQQLAISPEQPPLWLLLGQVRAAMGNRTGSLKSWYQAIQRAQASGAWTSRETTPPELVDDVLAVIEATRIGRRELLLDSFADLRSEFGSARLSRVDRAIAAYLGELEARPRHPRQRPKFLFMPDLPQDPFVDPFRQPWAATLRDAYPSIRREALELLAEETGFAPFLEFQPGARMDDYIGGDGAHPAWDAFFFYRHGQRFDANHSRCPVTSSVLDGIELCRIRDQAPEICFSLLRAGSHIKAHHGVTNTRLVMHLPLLVPAECALNLLDVGAHAWREGELMMFDDTFEHEAWNRSDSPRLILLMDCWNPDLSDVEKRALKQLVETISDFEAA